ncbi:MAG: aromatic ring-hydroxylating dioxygenase subunit alpha [Pseudomonadales bacterium]|nr:aromatic ring-hydroxylating dioxygenase subunit alpha [Pseudomonadales bacterium]
MRQIQPADLFDPEDIARIRQPLPQACTLPPTAYRDPLVWAAEVETLFRRDWLCVARVEQLANVGDYVCADLPDQPIVVSRSSSGLHASSRICLHRAMPIADGAGNASRFVCPYHNWTYELDGRLRSAPMMEGVQDFDPGSCRLPTLALEVWQGFVFVNRDTQAAALAPQLEGLEGFIENYQFDQLVIVETVEFDSPWNWKILVENFMEAYHHIGTHRHTFEPVYPARQSRVPDNGGAPWLFLHMPGQHREDSGLPLFPALNESQQRDLIACCVYPTLLFGATATTAVWYQLEPTAHDRMRLRIHLLARPELAAHLSNEERAAFADGVRAIHTEDIAANLGPWRGLQAGLTTQGRLSSFEKGIWQLNQLWADRLGLG